MRPASSARLDRLVPRSDRRLPRWAPPAAALLTVGLVVLGVWVAGAVLTEDEAVAERLTGAWFVLAVALAVVAGLRWRQLAIPVVAGAILTSGVVGGYLLAASSVDRVVDEQVVVAPAPAATTAGATAEAAPVPRARFRDGAHPTSGVATLVPLPGGGRALTLTGFVTDPGPDLRVYLVPGREGEVDGDAVDLGALKGNRGDQQYEVPDGATAGAVVIWCRAFSVAFGTASF